MIAEFFRGRTINGYLKGKPATEHAVAAARRTHAKQLATSATGGGTRWTGELLPIRARSGRDEFTQVFHS